MCSRISDTIKQDHREIESYYKVILSAKDADEQTRYQNMFTWELARHSVGEELILYPAMERYIRDGIEVTDKDRREHQKVNEYLKKFQDMDCTDAKFIPTIRTLMAILSNHIQEEETTDLVKLEEAITGEESDRLARSFGRTKMFVPSRSHPRAPDRPPFETAVGLMAAPLDHLMDLFRKWPDEALTPNPSMD